MSKRTDVVLLSDINEALMRIFMFTKDFSDNDFWTDIKTQDAVVRNLEIIGEATKNLSDEIKDCNSDVQWKSMAGMRDKLIHSYFGINLDIVWSIVKVDLPVLKERVDSLLKG